MKTDHHFVPTYHDVLTKPHDDKIHTDLIRACSEGQFTPRLKHLLRRGADIEYRDGMNCTPLHHAAFSGRVETVQHLIDAGADINAVDDWFGTPLCLAAGKDHIDVIKLLIKNNVDVNKDCGYPGSAVHVACAEGSFYAALDLYGGGAEITEDRINWLYDWSDIKSKSLMDHSARCQPMSGKFWTEEIQYGSALGLAVHRGHNLIVRVLLQETDREGPADYVNKPCIFDLEDAETNSPRISSRKLCPRNLFMLAAARMDAEMLSTLFHSAEIDAESFQDGASDSFKVALERASGHWKDQGVGPGDVESCRNLLLIHGVCKEALDRIWLAADEKGLLPKA